VWEQLKLFHLQRSPLTASSDSALAWKRAHHRKSQTIPITNVRRVRTVKGRKQKTKVKGKEKDAERGLEITPGSIMEQDSEAPKVPTGTLYQLSESMQQETREIAATGLFATVYDNININFRNPEEILGRHGEQQILVILAMNTELTGGRYTREWYLCYTCAAI
jgi:hypothetical protein